MACCSWFCRPHFLTTELRLHLETATEHQDNGVLALNRASRCFEILPLRNCVTAARPLGPLFPSRPPYDA
ncbi:hypothetical protein VTK56DRAFT_9645 [Thermocarpiscus australiensis]